MVVTNWKGRAIENKMWYNSRNGKMYASKEYDDFIQSLSATIKTKCQIKFDKIDLVISLNLISNSDHHGLIKPIVEAIQKAGIIESYKNIGIVTLMPPAANEDTGEDEIWLFIRGFDN